MDQRIDFAKYGIKKIDGAKLLGRRMIPLRASPPWYLRWPARTIDLVSGDNNPRWFCTPEIIEEATEFRPRRVYAAYCGAPPGVRCRCGAQLAGHDPGDEQS